MNKIVIDGKSSDVIAYKIDTSEITLKTVIEVDRGIIPIMRFEGVDYDISDGGKVYELLGNRKPIIDKKLDCTIIVVKRDSTFPALWGTSIDNVRFNDLDIDIRICANGGYSFRVVNPYGLMKNVGFSIEEMVTAEKIKDRFINANADRISAILKREFAKIGGDLSKLNINSVFREMILDECNAKFNESGAGIQMTSIDITNITYADESQDLIDSLVGDKLNVARIKIIDQGRRITLATEKEFKSLDVRCQRCGKINSSKTCYCAVCGTKL